MRHKWEKRFFNGKFSSFELSSICLVCGCKRTKLTFGYEYETKNGMLSEKAPACVVVKVERELINIPGHPCDDN